MPLLWGWYAVVRMCLQPIVLYMQLQVEEVNWVPLSVVTVCRVPNLATQFARKASAQTSAVMDLTGTTSAHRVLLLMMVSR